MAEFTWVFDAPSGVYKNHYLSSKLRKAAIVDCKFAQFCQPEPGFGKNKGESVTITKVKNLAVPTSAVLDEQTLIPIDTFQIATGAITVSEMGRGVEITNVAKVLSKYDLDNPIQKALRDQLQIILDNSAAAAFKTAYPIFIPTSLVGGTWDVDGTPSATATVNLNKTHMGVIRDYMRDTLVVPYYKGERYTGILSTKAARGIKNDPDFEDWRKYIKPGDVLFNSEIGQIEQIRCIESNNTSALSNAKGTGSVLGEAVIFGSEAVALAEVETPELRAAIPSDHGRKQSVAWYGILAFGLIWALTATAGEARVVRITSM